jgi:type IV conjugative transfer system protein TraE
MDRATLDNKNQKIITQRNIFLLFSALLSISTVMLSCLLFIKKERIVVIPTVGPTLWVEEAKVSDTYLEKFGSYMSDLLLTRTPADVDLKNKIILESVHPTFYHEARKLLQQDRDRIIKSNQSLLFRPSRSFIDPIKQSYIIEGELLIFIGKTGEKPSCAQSEFKRFTFEFHTQGGKLLLKSLKRENI